MMKLRCPILAISRTVAVPIINSLKVWAFEIRNSPVPMTMCTMLTKYVSQELCRYSPTRHTAVLAIGQSYVGHIDLVHEDLGDERHCRHPNDGATGYLAGGILAPAQHAHVAATDVPPVLVAPSHLAGGFDAKNVLSASQVPECSEASH
jgi:hypothetical protein